MFLVSRFGVHTRFRPCWGLGSLSRFRQGFSVPFHFNIAEHNLI